MRAPHRALRARSVKSAALRSWSFSAAIAARMNNHNLSVAAAGVGFYAMLAAFPAIAAFISIYGLIADPHNAVQHFAILHRVMPAQAFSLFMDQLKKIVDESSSSLGLGALFGLALAIWSAGAGVRALMSSLNVVYGAAETRSVVAFYALSTAFTLAAICLGVFALTMIAAAPVIMHIVYLGNITETLISLARWPLLAVLVAGVMCILYRYGAARRKKNYRSVLVGAGIATLLWVIASALFSLYVSAFGNYNATYGALGSMVILLLWFYISAFLVLLGAELNEEIALRRNRMRGLT